MEHLNELLGAISSGDIEETRGLIGRIEDLSVLTEDGLDLVSYAMECEAEKVASFLIEYGVDPMNPRARYTALQCALEHPYYDLIDRILDKGINLNVKGLDEPGYPLHVLCEGYLEPRLLQRFLDLGADPSLRDDMGRTAEEILRELYGDNLSRKDAMDQMISMLQGESEPDRGSSVRPWWKFW